MRRIELTSGHIALVDSEDAARVARFRWCPVTSASGVVYAHIEGLYMHRLIMGVGPGDEVDHANGDGLDNRRTNLRVATHSQNLANARKVRRKRPCTSRYKGVYWAKTERYWIARIYFDKKERRLGRFSSEEAAARAYDAAALARWGEFARLNFGGSR